MTARAVICHKSSAHMTYILKVTCHILGDIPGFTNSRQQLCFNCTVYYICNYSTVYDISLRSTTYDWTTLKKSIYKGIVYVLVFIGFAFQTRHYCSCPPLNLFRLSRLWSAKLDTIFQVRSD